MIKFFLEQSTTVQALMATIFTWLLTAIGASLVFFFKEINRRVLDSMLGFASGVMIAASFWSLLAPSIALSEQLGYIKWLPPLLGFLSGGLFLLAIDKILPHIHPGLNNNKPEGIKTEWQRSVLLVLAITLHNIPEGLAVGIAFGAVGAGISDASISGAIALAIGIGIQNLPEGAAVSIPLRREGFSRMKSFLYGQSSGIVEPIAGVIGAIAVLSMQFILPFALAFAAGAMIYVVVEELIPQSQSGQHSDYATIGALIGFSIMMCLDVALG